MAKTELRLSSKISKETGMGEVLVRFFHSGIDLYSKTGVFVNPEFFEYYIDREKTGHDSPGDREQHRCDGAGAKKGDHKKGNEKDQRRAEIPYQRERNDKKSGKEDKQIQILPPEKPIKSGRSHIDIANFHKF